MQLWRQLDDQGEPLAIGGGHRRSQELARADPSPEAVDGMFLPLVDPIDPGRRGSASQFLAIPVEQIEPEMLAVVNSSPGIRGRFFAALLVSLHRVAQKF